MKPLFSIDEFALYHFQQPFCVLVLHRARSTKQQTTPNAQERIIQSSLSMSETMQRQVHVERLHGCLDEERRDDLHEGERIEASKKQQKRLRAQNERRAHCRFLVIGVFLLPITSETENDIPMAVLNEHLDLLPQVVPQGRLPKRRICSALHRTKVLHGHHGNERQDVRHDHDTLVVKAETNIQ